MQQLRPQTPNTPHGKRQAKPWLTMYDLPSQFSQERGLPDIYHDLQPQLLSETLSLPDYRLPERFSACDINLYYDQAHPLWHKRPDWMLVVGVPLEYEQEDLRLSYVVWDEGVAPTVIVELLSPGTEKQDLGPFYKASDIIDPSIADEAEIDDWVGDGQLPPKSPAVQPSNGKTKGKQRPPAKWEVYESILKVPYYIVFSRYTGKLRFFRLIDGKYQAQPLAESGPQIWIAELGIGLGIWQGAYNGEQTRRWIRWCDQQGNWFPTHAEREALEAQRADLEAQRANLADQRAELEAQRANAEAQRAAAADQRAEAEAQRAAQERQLRLVLLAKLKEQGIEIEGMGS
jgi:Uma2 family endonuclease